MGAGESRLSPVGVCLGRCGGGGEAAVERLVVIGLLLVAGLAFGEMSGAALVAVVCAALLVTLGVETVRHREELRQPRSAPN